MAGIVVKPRARILHGHDWVFSSEVLKVFGSPADGDVISLKDGKDRLIASAIIDVFGAKNIIERDDAPIRRAEGLELQSGMLEGAAPSGPITVEINESRAAGATAPLQFEVDLFHGQKTGFYLDQTQNYE